MDDVEEFEDEDGLGRKFDGLREGRKYRNCLRLSLWLGFKDMGRRREQENTLLQ